MIVGTGESPVQADAHMEIGGAALAIRNLSLDPARTEKWGAEDRARIRAKTGKKKKAADVESHQAVSAEPALTDKESIEKWKVWMLEEAEAYAHTVHPRKHEDGVPKKLSICCSHDELMGATNVRRTAGYHSPTFPRPCLRCRR